MHEFEEPVHYSEEIMRPCFSKLRKECPRMISCKSKLSEENLNYDFQFQEINKRIFSMGPSTCEFPFHVMPSQLNFDDISLPEEKLEESNALKRWDYWLKQRKIMQEHLMRKTNNDVCDLLFNKSDDYRKVSHYERSKGRRRCYFENFAEEKFKPNINMDDLSVVGQGILREKPVDVPISIFDVIPQIIITPPEDEDNDNTIENTSEFSLVIDGVEMKYNLDKEWKGHEEDGDSPTWNIDFGCTNEIGKLYEKVVYFENRGNVAIKYKWTMKPCDKRPLQTLLKPYKYEPWFFFDKNTGTFLPGQKYCLKFYLMGKKSGTRTETWFLNTFPPLHSNVKHATFKFFAVVVGDTNLEEIQTIENYLNRRVGERIAKYILNDIIIRSLTEPHYFLDYIEYRSISNLCKTNQAEWDLHLGTLVKLVLTNIKSKKEKENYWREICTESKNALKPVRGKKRKNKKYVMAYEVLCKMINFIEIDYEYSKSCVSFNPRLKIDCECDWECRENGEDEEGESYYDDDKTMILDGEIDFSLTSYAGLKSEESFKIIDFSRFYTYNRLCRAVEEIVGIIETRRFLDPWCKKKFTDY
ncbi:hypothetical protein Phum_PHUM411780 [Pediculus humanus corporis]|uniref:MYCBP-associated protein n=1 Tax=Pediculus humanus subsp. corporis TaxID=121224 RepID=E0VS49_PEDHC|nr:uncharacterized protein Phum_PHUM411780 [Pediculus humanus corporis]EEB16205.1 hypothetical protein Phum_PHUM411780 [Pediculus humanus corporis]